MHGHENIIELLVQTYKADSNIRDYSGKKAKQYLRNSASTKAQRAFKRGSIRHNSNQKLLLTRRLGTSSAAVSGRSLDDSFTRTASFRKSNRARALSSLILSKSSNMKNAMFRSTWAGSADNIEDYRSRSPSRTPPNSSPSLSRRQSYADKERMPPPSGLFRKSRKGSAVHSSKDSIHSDDGVFSSNTVTRSESEPSLQTPRSSNHTYV
ncbi:unnamed protein product [Mytilus coruscus]|uniref:Uncharacterized protein n=1 Tax=Mytilus coruscus TaxID=42192 RepID=A0A6J8BJU6_MYTCO|nr:unnamed protein product [Mytilus coruscus]